MFPSHCLQAWCRLLPCLVGLLVMGSLMTDLSAATSSITRPNIIFVLADDLGPDGLGVYGSEDFVGDTPRIDQLAANGLRFERAYASAICSPSRTQFMTGQYPFRNGCLDIDGSSSYITEETSLSIAQILQSAGYRNMLIGKGMSMPGQPSRWGFDEWATAKVGAYWGEDIDLNGITLSSEPNEYTPDLLHTEALRFIRRNEDQPFFLCYSLINPHTPILPTPQSDPNTTDPHELYADNIRYIDQVVGSLDSVLDSLGIRDDTLLIFTGDNGSYGTYQSRLWDPQTETYRKISGAKADRDQNREGGSLVPLIIQWPRVVAAGITSEALVDFSDFFATFAELTETPIPTGYKLDSYSFAPLLKNEEWRSRNWVYYQIEDNWCVRGKFYRLNGNGQFFDVSDLPFSMSEMPANSGIAQAENHRRWFGNILKSFDPANGPTFETHQDNHTHAYHGPYEPYLWKKTYWNTYDLWATEVSGDWSDPDGDGVRNIFERAFGWDPTNGTDRMTWSKWVDGRLQITHPLPVGEVLLFPQFSKVKGDPWLEGPHTVTEQEGEITLRDAQPDYVNEKMRLWAERLVPQNADR